MQKIDTMKWMLAGILAVSSQLGIAAPDEVTPDQVVNAIEGAFGVTPGERRNHTKGTCALGRIHRVARSFGLYTFSTVLGQDPFRSSPASRWPAAIPRYRTLQRIPAAWPWNSDFPMEICST